MRFFKHFLIISMILFLANQILANQNIKAQGNEISATFMTNPPNPVSGQEVNFTFTLKDLQGNPITYLDLTDTKIMHVYGIRDDMKDFIHIHADNTSTPGLFQTNYTFKEDGNYKFWVEVTYNKVPIVKSFDLIKVGNPQSLSIEKNYSTEKKYGIFDVKITTIPLKPKIGQDDINIIVTYINETTGTPLPVLFGPYLGHTLHFTIISDDLSYFAHVHPNRGAAPPSPG